MQVPRKKIFIALLGPTGVGKTECSLALAAHLPIEIINMDVGQLYRPFSIGTAKPDWQQSKTSHHLFDLLDQPCDYTVVEYRKQALALMEKIWSRENIPVFVGGSGFYLSSLFFPPEEGLNFRTEQHVDAVRSKNLWNELNCIDPVRAQAVHPNDTYRIKRALAIWHATGKKPSTYEFIYSPPGDSFIIFLTRNRQELYQRINRRTETMLEQGWQEEVEKLLGTRWVEFIQKKRLIGYPEVYRLVSEPISLKERTVLIEKIQRATRAYAKRQETFWRMFHKKISAAQHAHEQQKENNSFQSHLVTINLTEIASSQYISELLQHIKMFINEKFE